MKFTVQDYKNSLLIKDEWRALTDSPFFFEEFVLKRIDEIENPKQLQYKCIQDTWPYRIDDITEDKTISGFLISELPFHFELIAKTKK